MVQHRYEAINRACREAVLKERRERSMLAATNCACREAVLKERRERSMLAEHTQYVPGIWERR